MNEIEFLKDLRAEIPGDILFSNEPEKTTEHEKALFAIDQMIMDRRDYIEGRDIESIEEEEKVGLTANNKEYEKPSNV